MGPRPQSANSRQWVDWLPVGLATYTGLLVAAVVSLATRQSVGAPSVLVAAGFAALAGLVVGVGVPDLGIRLSATRLHYALVGLPLGAALALGGWTMLGRDLTSAAAAPLVVGVLGSVPAGIVVVAADNRRVRAVRAVSSPTVSWRASPPPSVVRRWKRIYGGTGLTLIVGGIGLVFATDVNATYAMAVGGGVLGQYLTVDRTREFEVTDRGVVVTASATIRAQFIEWERIEAYTLTEEALTIRRWLPGSSLAADRREIDDVDSVTTALGRYLDRGEA